MNPPRVWILIENQPLETWKRFSVDGLQKVGSFEKVFSIDF
jgi:hypothetical protein